MDRIVGPDQPSFGNDFRILIQIAIGIDSHIHAAIGTGARSESNTLLNQPIDAGNGAGGRRMRAVDFQGDTDQVDPS